MAEKVIALKIPLIINNLQAAFILKQSIPVTDSLRCSMYTIIFFQDVLKKSKQLEHLVECDPF